MVAGRRSCRGLTAIWQRFGYFVEHKLIALLGKMPVAANVQVAVPVIGVVICVGKERREGVDETLAVPDAEILPDLDLAAGAIGHIELDRPRIDDDRQG